MFIPSQHKKPASVLLQNSVSQPLPAADPECIANHVQLILVPTTTSNMIKLKRGSKFIIFRIIQEKAALERKCYDLAQILQHPQLLSERLTAVRSGPKQSVSILLFEIVKTCSKKDWKCGPRILNSWLPRRFAELPTTCLYHLCYTEAGAQGGFQPGPKWLVSQVSWVS